MGAVKQQYIESLGGSCLKFVQDQTGDPDADENHEDWNHYANEWFEMNDMHEADQYEDWRNELDWYEAHSYTNQYEHFVSELTHLKKLLNAPNIDHGSRDLINKMAYAFAVTLMETFLGDTVRSLILLDDKYLANSFNTEKELNLKKVTLKEAYLLEGGLKGEILSKL
jgi:hypothetical protein